MSSPASASEAPVTHNGAVAEEANMENIAPQQQQEEPMSFLNHVISQAKEEAKMENLAAQQQQQQNGRLAIHFMKMSESAHAPTYGSGSAAGADLYSAEDCIVPAKGKLCVPTHIQVALPYGYYGRVAPRSGLAAKHFIDVGAGVVDSDYRGELKVLLFNFGEADFHVTKGDRIAQFICERIAHCTYVQLESLETTERGVGGFGSTGV